MDLSGMAAPIHMRTDANNLVTTAAKTTLPEQRETIHMIQMLRKEACSGSIEDLAHVVTKYCLSDALTKATIKPDVLIQAVETGVLPAVDAQPTFRSTLQHKAYEVIPVTGDNWSQTEDAIVRHHNVPRTAYFEPQPGGLPEGVSLEDLGPRRLTEAFCADGRHAVLSDTWTSKRPRLTSPWTGTTTLYVVPRQGAKASRK